MNTLFNAIRSKKTNEVKKVLESFPELLNTKDERGPTPLLLASYLGLLEITTILLNYKPNLDLKIVLETPLLWVFALKEILKLQSS